MMMMRKSAPAALAAVALLGSVGVAAAQRVPASNAPMMIAPNAEQMLVPQVICAVYVDVNITLQNKWASTLPSGTVIQWTLSTGQFGQFVLPLALVPGDAIMIENALNAAVRGRVTCTASVIGLVAQ